MPLNVKMLEDSMAVIASILGGAYLFYKGIRAKMPSIKKPKIDLEAITHCMGSHQAKLQSDRVDLLEIKRKDDEHWVTLIAESIVDSQPSYLGKFDLQKADKEYKNILLSVKDEGTYIVEDVHLLPDTLIKDAAIAIGLKQILYVFGDENNKHEYIIVVSYVNPVDIDSAIKEDLRLLKSEIVKILNK